MTKNFAHRGFSGKYPENTMLAFEKAIEAGCEGMEFDVQFSKDGEMVIFHDETVNRTTNGKGRIKDHTFEELSLLDASYIYMGTYGVNRIPTLREYFDLVKDLPVISNIELKTGIYEYEGIERSVYDLIKEYDIKDRIIISSFNHFTIRRMKAIDPTMKCGLLEESWLIDAGKYVKTAGVECYHPIFRCLNDDVVNEVKSHGIEINTWTVNEVEDIEDMIRKNVDSVISNYPDRVKEVLDSMK